MSDRVTWEQCPSCGGSAAVGWSAVAWVGGEPVEEVPEEYDCRAGCHLHPDELRAAFGDAH
jgi:hypothetical protein